MPEELTPEQAQKMLDAPRCAACKSLLHAGRSHCTACGAPVLRWKCADCGCAIESGKSYCAPCGAARVAALDESAASNAVAPKGYQAGDGFVLLMLAMVFAGTVVACACSGPYDGWGRIAGAAIAGAGLQALLIRGAIVSAGLALGHRRHPAATPGAPTREP